MLGESPVVVGPGGEEARQPHGRQHPPSQPCASGEGPVHGIHRGFHADHADQAHADGSAKGGLQRLCSAQDDGFQNNAGANAGGHGQSHHVHGMSRGVGGIEVLEAEDYTEVANAATDQAPHGVVG